MVGMASRDATYLTGGLAPDAPVGGGAPAEGAAGVGTADQSARALAFFEAADIADRMAARYGDIPALGARAVASYLRTLAALVAALVLFASSASADILNTVILQAAMPVTGAQTTSTVSDATFISVYDLLYIDTEALLVVSKTGDVLTVQRAYGGTAQQQHDVGATVYSGTATSFASSDATIGSSCLTATVTPWINIRNGRQFQCIRSKWTRVVPPAPGAGTFVWSPTPTFDALAVGNTARVGSDYDIYTPLDPSLDDAVDLQHTFSTATTFGKTYLYGVKAFFTADPPANTGIDFYGLNVEARIKSGNTRTFARVTGSDHGAYHLGSGTLTVLNGITGQANLGERPGDGLGGPVISAQGVRGKITNNSVQQINEGRAGEFQIANASSGTIDRAVLTWEQLNNDGTGPMTHAYGRMTELRNTSTGHMGDTYGWYLKAPVNTGGGAWDAHTGVYMEDQTLAGTTTNFALQSLGGKFYFLGSGGVGTATPGTVLPAGFTAGRMFDVFNAAADAGVSARSFSTAYGADLWSKNSDGFVYLDSRGDGTSFGTYFRTRTSGTPVLNMKLLGNGTVTVPQQMIVGTTSTFSGTTPSVSSGFGTSPSVTAGQATSFRLNVGTGGSASAGVIAMGYQAATGWNCFVQNITAQAANTGDKRTVQTASSTTTVTVQNQTISTGGASAWAASDVLALICAAY